MKCPDIQCGSTSARLWILGFESRIGLNDRSGANHNILKTKSHIQFAFIAKNAQESSRLFPRKACTVYFRLHVGYVMHSLVRENPIRLQVSGIIRKKILVITKLASQVGMVLIFMASWRLMAIFSIKRHWLLPTVRFLYRVISGWRILKIISLWYY